MDSTLLIFSCIALAAFTTVCVTLAIVAVRVSNNIARMSANVHQLGRDVSELKQASLPVLHEAKGTIHRVNNSLDAVNVGTDLFKSLAVDIKELERELISKVKIPLLDVATLLAGSAKAATAFVRTMIARRSEKK